LFRRCAAHVKGDLAMLDDNINPYAAPSEVESDVVPRKARMATQTATIVPVPDPYCCRVLTNSHTFGMVFIIVVTVALNVAISSWVALPVILTGLNYDSRVTVILFFVAGIAIFVILQIVGCCFIPIVENIYWRWLLRRAFRKHPDSLVRESDPDSMIVNMMPRMSWRSILRADNPEIRDIGLLKLDSKRSEVLIESDRERFRIPHGSILECEPDVFHEQPGTIAVNGFVRLVVKLQDGTREIRFCLRYNGFKSHTDNDKRLMAMDICRRIDSLAMPIV
jgi:hypothetical protein